jgi:hypothetical protein
MHISLANSRARRHSAILNIATRDRSGMGAPDDAVVAVRASLPLEGARQRQRRLLVFQTDASAVGTTDRRTTLANTRNDARLAMTRGGEGDPFTDGLVPRTSEPTLPTCRRSSGIAGQGATLGHLIGGRLLDEIVVTALQTTALATVAGDLFR